MLILNYYIIYDFFFILEKLAWKCFTLWYLLMWKCFLATKSVVCILSLKQCHWNSTRQTMSINHNVSFVWGFVILLDELRLYFYQNLYSSSVLDVFIKTGSQMLPKLCFWKDNIFILTFILMNNNLTAKINDQLFFPQICKWCITGIIFNITFLLIKLQ